MNVHSLLNASDTRSENTTVLDILNSARTIIADERRWTKGHFALTQHGDDCDPCADAAARFCLEGAIWRAAGSVLWRGADEVLRGILDVPSLTQFNDINTHAEVLAALDLGIGQLRGVLASAATAASCLTTGREASTGDSLSRMSLSLG